MKNNKGFSLVELIVATAILAVLAIAVGTMMSSGSTLFSRLLKSEKTTQNMTTALEQVQGYVMDCDVVFRENSKKLYVGDTTNQKYYYIYWDTKDGRSRLYITERIYDAATSEFVKPSPNGGSLCNNISSLKFTLAYKELEAPLLTVTMEKDGHTESVVVALRNVKSTDIKKDIDTFYNAVKGVS